MDPLPSLAEIEQDPSFLALDQTGKDEVYHGYFTTREREAKNEDDYNSILKEKTDRGLAKFRAEYSAANPDDADIDIDKLTPEMRTKYDGLNSQLTELDYNTNLAPYESYKAGDMEDSGRSLKIKPYRYNGQPGYTLLYPNGEVESVTGLSDKQQLATFLNEKRADKFGGKREGAFDSRNPYAETELESITGLLTNAVQGVDAVLPTIKTGFLATSMAFDASKLDDAQKSLDLYRESQSIIEQLDPQIEREQNKVDNDFMGADKALLSRLKQERQAAQDKIDKKNQNVLGQAFDVDFANTSTIAKSPEEVEPVIKEQVSDLIRKTIEMNKTPGASVTSKYNAYIQSLPEADRGTLKAMTDYFANRPGEIVPYASTIFAQNIPNLVATVGSSAAGSVVGGPTGAAIAGQQMGYAIEYGSTILSEIQTRAAEEGQPLNNENINRYFNDPNFMSRVREKGQTRGAIIGAADAVIGGGIEKIVEATAMSALKKTVSGAVLGMGSEMSGEAIAQIATEGKIDATEVVNEGLGGLGVSAAVVARQGIDSIKQSLQQRKQEIANRIKPDTTERDQAAAREDLMKRAEDMMAAVKIPATVDPGGINIPANEEPEAQSQLTDEQQVAEAAAGVKPVPRELSGERKSQVPSLLVSEMPERITQDNVDEKAPGLLFKALDLYHSLTGSKPNANPADREANARQQAAAILKDNFHRTVFDLVSDRDSFPRIMKELEASGYDASAQGRLMNVIGIQPSDANRRIITNVLGNYWSAAGNQGATDYEFNGLLLSEQLDRAYREKANVTSYYDMTDPESINRNDILINMAPEATMQDEGGKYTAQGQYYMDSGMSYEETMRRASSALNADVKRAPIFNDTLNDKFEEAYRMQRPNIKIARVTDMGGTTQQMADAIMRAYDGQFIMKSRGGFGGSGIDFGHQFKSAIDLKKKLDDLNAAGQLTDRYVETMLELPDVNYRQRRKTANGEFDYFNEHRVHLYVDKDGQAHVFRNLTFNKDRSLWAQEERARRSDAVEDTLFVIPDDPNNPTVRLLQEYARQVMSGKKGFEDMIFGLDVAIAKYPDGDGPIAFEANGLTYGMSGWLGRAETMTEILSEMAGRPSILAGLYELAKVGLTPSQLKDVSSRVSAGVPFEWQRYPEYYDALNNGVALFNRFVPKGKWFEAMANITTLPFRGLVALYDAISRVFSGTVDAIFNRNQRGERRSQYFKQFPRGAYRIDGIQKGFGGPTGDDWVPMYQNVTIMDASHPFDGSTLTIPLNGESQLTDEQIQAVVDAKRDQYTGLDIPAPKSKKEKTNAEFVPKKNQKLGDYIQQVLQSPKLKESHREVLQFVAQNASDALIKGITVTPTKKAYNFYNIKTVKMGIRSDVNPQTVVHEIVHAVTSDFIAINQANVNGILGEGVGILDGYFQLTEPSKRDYFVERGIEPAFIDATQTYLDFLESLGINKDNYQGYGLGDPVTGYKYQEENRARIPYGAISLDEFFAEGISNPTFQKRLNGIPSNRSGSKSLFKRLLQTLGRLIGIPFNKQTLLEDVIRDFMATVTNTENNLLYEGSSMYETEFGTWAVYPAPVSDTDFTSVGPETYRRSEVSDSTKAVAQEAETEEEELTAEQIADNEVKVNRMGKLVAEFPELFPDDLEVSADNLVVARERVLDYLNQRLEDKDDAGKETTDRKRQLAAELVENKILALKQLPEIIHNPGITDSIASLITDAMEYIMEMTEDMNALTTAKLRYYNNALGSIADGGPPVGLRYVLPEMYIEHQMQYLNDLTGKKGPQFNRPVAGWRRGIFFGIAPKTGGLVSHSSEIAYIGRTKAAHNFLQDLMGIYRSQIDDKILEEDANNIEFYEELNRRFPVGSITPLQASRIGVVARLAQYQRNHATSPVNQIIERDRQLTESIKDSMLKTDKTRSTISQMAYDSIMNGQDISNLGDENAIINYLEGALTQPERDVLNKVRQQAADFLPALKVVKAITRSSGLQDWVNYVHDANVSPSEEISESNIQKAFTSMADVIHDRKGLDPETSFPELDIRSIAEHVNKSASYEKHTGIERYILWKALDTGSPIMRAIDSQYPTKMRPISDRLRNLAVVHHESMTRSQWASRNPMIAFAESAMNATLGTVIVGVNAMAKNFVSASVARGALMGLGTAITDAFVYESNRKRINAFLEKNVPTQFQRSSLADADTLKGRDQRWNLKGKMKRWNQANDGALTVAAKTMLHLPAEIMDLYSKKILDTLSAYSNGIPEKHNAFAIWTAAYIHYGKEHGTIKDANDFVNNLILDKAAATKANDFVTRSLGYAPDKASKGSFWNGSSAEKQFLSKTFFVFRQQAIGLAIEFQNNMVKAAQLGASGQLTEARQAATIALSAMSSSMAFRAMGIALATSMVPLGIDRFFKSTDDEERKRKLMETKIRNAANARRANVRDIMAEMAMTTAPITSGGAVAETLMSLGMNHTDRLVEPDALFNDFKVEKKADIKKELEAVRDEITRVEAAYRTKGEYMAVDPGKDEYLQKLQLTEKLLSDKARFSYFPNDPEKVFFGSLGGYGIGMEMMNEAVEEFTKDDLDDKKQQQLKEMLARDFTYQDPLAGEGYPWQGLFQTSNVLRKMFPSEWAKDGTTQVPTELFWRSVIKAGQNPKVIVERARTEMAKDAVTRLNQNQAKAQAVLEKYLPQEKQPNAPFTLKME